MWNDYYRAMTHRNIGLLTEAQQDKLKNSCVALCGVGGLGGPVGEMLARTGVENFVLLDNGQFEPSNLNRQIFCFSDTFDQYKVDVTETYLKKINPAIKVRKFLDVNKDNVVDFLKGVDVVVMGIDSVVPVLQISREAHRNGIPLVEGWCVPLGNVRVFDKHTITLEKAYDLNLENTDLEKLTDEQKLEFTFKTVSTMMNVEGAEIYATPQAIENYRTKMQATTLAPLVWLTCSLLAAEVMKVILKWGDIAYAPPFQIYDAIYHKVRAHRLPHLEQ